MGLCWIWERLTLERGSSSHLVFTPNETKPKQKKIFWSLKEVISGTTIMNEKTQKRWSACAWLAEGWGSTCSWHPQQCWGLALVAWDPAWDAMSSASCKSFSTMSTSLVCPVVRKCVHVSQISSLNSLWKRNDLLSLPPSFMSLQRLNISCISPFCGENLFVHWNSQASARTHRFISEITRCVTSHVLHWTSVIIL